MAWEPSMPTRMTTGRMANIRMGLCRMRPPPNGVWPTTKANDWCCDFKMAQGFGRETNAADEVEES
jgi:hypothetical protein